MVSELKIISRKLDSYETLDLKGRADLLRQIQQIAEIQSIERGAGESVCPVTQELLRLPCTLKGCRFHVDQPWTKNCALNFLLSQEREKLTVPQVSLLYKKSTERVDAIFKKCFKIVQRFYLRNTLRNRSAPQFHHVPGFCVACETKLTDQELSEPELNIQPGFGYCSYECKKAYPPAYFEIEQFFQSEFIRVVEVGAEIFTFCYLEEVLGFQPNVLRNRLEKLRDEPRKKKRNVRGSA